MPAGYGYMMPLPDASIANVKRNFDVNVFGVLEVTHALFPLLRAAMGMVVYQSSIAGVPGICQPFIASHSASKTTLTDSANMMRVELAPFDIKVVTLFTGGIRTRFWQPGGHVQGSHQSLSASFPYAPVKDHAEKTMRGETNSPRQQAREGWARQVVGNILKPNPPIAVRHGALSVKCES